MNCIMRYVKQTLFISLYSQDPQLKVRRWIVRIVESFEDSEFSLKDQTEVAWPKSSQRLNELRAY